MSQELHTQPAVGDDLAVPRAVTIRLRVTEAERDAMQVAADKSRLTLSEWIRQRCLKTTITIEAPVIKPPTKRRR